MANRIEEPKKKKKKKKIPRENMYPLDQILGGRGDVVTKVAGKAETG